MSLFLYISNFLASVFELFCHPSYFKFCIHFYLSLFFTIQLKINSIFCALYPVNWLRTANCFGYYNHCIMIMPTWTYWRYYVSTKISPNILNLNRTEFAVCNRFCFIYILVNEADLHEPFTVEKKCTSSSNYLSVHRCIRRIFIEFMKTRNIAKTKEQLFV